MEKSSKIVLTEEDIEDATRGILPSHISCFFEIKNVKELVDIINAGEYELES